MVRSEFYDRLENNPIISAIADGDIKEALSSPAEVIFHLGANILSIDEMIRQTHGKGKLIFVHIDLAEGIGRDKSGVAYLKERGVDGIISTRSQLIRAAKEQGIFTVQRFFALDSKGIAAAQEMIELSRPDMIEIMPGVASKIIRRFAEGPIPVIAGGLIETKAEVTEALGSGAIAVSTGRAELWYL